MHFENLEELRAILWPRIDKSLLEGYLGGVFNEERNKFFAATLVNISAIDYDDFEYHHDLFSGSSSMFYDHEKTKKFVTADSWQRKSTRELIDENVYCYFSVSFIGALFEGEWFILKTLTFYGADKGENELKKHIENQSSDASFWHDSLFYPKAPRQYDELGEIVIIRDVLFEEYKDTPYLVAILKQEKKEKINRAFVNYLDEAFIKPFFEKLRIAFPSEYADLSPLRVNYTMIFPAHKKQTIFCAFVQNSLGKWLLRYFLLSAEDEQFYEWTYFKGIEYDDSFFYSDLIINDLKTVSNWDNDSFLDSSCTLDDENFWSAHVFKKEDGNFLYLKPIEIKSM